MKKFIAALAVALFLAGGQAIAGNYDSDGGHGGCSNQAKWEDT